VELGGEERLAQLGHALVAHRLAQAGQVVTFLLGDVVADLGHERAQGVFELGLTGLTRIEHDQCVLHGLMLVEGFGHYVLAVRFKRVLHGRVDALLLGSGVDGQVEDHLVHQRPPVTLAGFEALEQGLDQAVVGVDERGDIV